eukprot:4479413-Prymnesium_polylepis.2
MPRRATALAQRHATQRHATQRRSGHHAAQRAPRHAPAMRADARSLVRHEQRRTLKSPAPFRNHIL